MLAAGTSFQFQPGYSVSNPTSTVIGSEIAVTNSGTTLGTATNSGIILADQGDVTMVGHTRWMQAGVILATTSVDTRGTVHLLTDTSDTTAAVNLAANSITEILPEDDGQTALDSQREANLASSIVDNGLRLTQKGPLNTYNTLADTLGESRIEISTGGSVTLATGAMALAQGGQVAVSAGQSVALAGGATIDVSGTNAVLPASADSAADPGHRALLPAGQRGQPHRRAGIRQCLYRPAHSLRRNRQWRLHRQHLQPGRPAGDLGQPGADAARHSGMERHRRPGDACRVPPAATAR